MLTLLGLLSEDIVQSSSNFTINYIKVYIFSKPIPKFVIKIEVSSNLWKSSGVIKNHIKKSKEKLIEVEKNK